ncbi:MAG TPA: Atu2307/SP_0267 family LLM class monooxygenase [Tepidiformaceae bacterium]|nr:Atu2307/SP_0267 family LLM class monooxygenase [Tepidiformaceae bacterium]
MIQHTPTSPGAPTIELGLYTFADVTDTSPESAARRLGELLAEAELAEQVGLDVFGVGEHHRADYAVSSPPVVLAAVAARTKRIRLTSAVTVLSSDDPVRVFEQFSTVDLLSGGRAEVMAGRGSFTESFPLFGYDLAAYDALFAEKLELLLKLRDSERVTWEGKLRPSIDDRAVYPRPLQDPLPVWIAVGGSPNSVYRAGTLGLPLALAIIGGAPDRFAGITDLYRDAYLRAGHDPAQIQLGINSPGFIADTPDMAAELAYPGYAASMTRIGKERGWSPMTRHQFDALRSPAGSLFVGDPDAITRKILYEHSLFGHTRFLMQMDIGGVPHDAILRSIELLGTRVAPAVRAALAAEPSLTP